MASAEKKQTCSPCLSPASTASSRCKSVAGWNICFCCFKKCLFVFAITARCFSFHFSNLSKVINQFRVLRELNFQKLNMTHLLKAGVYVALQPAHL